MGDPKKLHKKYETPRHPWEASRIEAERPLMKGYGLKNKKEIWKAQSLLRKFTRQAKSLSTIKTKHDENERQQLLNRVIKLGLLKQGQNREDVLELNVRDILNRRLQTLIVKHKLVKTPKQARQLIVHGHIAVGGQKITVPSYLVSLEEESKIGFLQNSSFNNPEHPEIILIKQASSDIKEQEEKEVIDTKRAKETKK